VATAMGITVTRIRTHELSNPLFAVKRPTALHCKTELFTEPSDGANERHIPWIADGSMRR